MDGHGGAPIVDAMWSRRTFLTTMVAGGVLAACGGSDSDGATSESEAGGSTPGGSADVVGRIIGDQLAQGFGQSAS